MDRLSQLMNKYGSDKGPGHHNYTPLYYKLLKGLQDSPLVFLEIGIGGYIYPDKGGESLRAWEEFFPKAVIHGIDIYDKCSIEKGRIHTHICSQNHPVQLTNLIGTIGSPDIVLDDGSHVSADIIVSFETLFPLLKKGGLYIIEDLETSYWAEHYYGNDNIDDLTIITTMNYFKRLSDSLNDTFFSYQGPKFDIESIAFYKGFILITKNL